MKSTLYLVFLLSYCVFATNVLSQDTLITVYNEVMPVKVIELDYSKNLIKYKKADFIDGPLHTEYLSNIFRVDLFNEEPIYNDPYENPYPDHNKVVPVSLRRMSLFSDEEIINDMQESFKSFNQLKIYLERDIKRNSEEHFKEIFDKVLSAAEQYMLSRNFRLAESFEWEYIYCKCESLETTYPDCLSYSPKFFDLYNNASSWGHGKFLFSEYFFYGKNDDVIAGFIGHEIGHALGHHRIEKVKKNKNLSRGAFWGGLGLGIYFDTDVSTMQRNLFELGNMTLLLPYNRKQELEADKIGVVLMTLAGYNPMELVNFWGTGEYATPTNYESTHPGGMERANAILSLINSPEFEILTFKR